MKVMTNTPKRLGIAATTLLMTISRISISKTLSYSIIMKGLSPLPQNLWASMRSESAEGRESGTTGIAHMFRV
jgi:hypothetical protein